VLLRIKVTKRRRASSAQPPLNLRIGDGKEKQRADEGGLAPWAATPSRATSNRRRASTGARNEGKHQNARKWGSWNFFQTLEQRGPVPGSAAGQNRQKEDTAGPKRRLNGKGPQEKSRLRELAERGAQLERPGIKRKKAQASVRENVSQPLSMPDAGSREKRPKSALRCLVARDSGQLVSRLWKRKRRDTGSHLSPCASSQEGKQRNRPNTGYLVECAGL